MATRSECDQYQPRARTKHVAVAVGKKLYVWGGWTGTDQYSRTMANYVEIFDFTSGVWCCKKTSGIPPRGLIDSAAACVGGSKLYVFGGYDGMLTKQCTNDLHELDLNTFEWRKVVAHNYLDIVDNPRPMHGARMCAHGGGLLVLYGGVLSTGQNCRDVFVYEITNGIWEKLATTGNRPPPLNGHTLTQIDASRVMLFGGQKDDGSCLNDVYILSVDTRKWIKVNFGIFGVKPPPRTNHSVCCIVSHQSGTAGPVIVTGGKCAKNVVLNDVWILDVEDQKWKQVDVGNQEIPRHSHCSVMFRAGADRIVTVINGGQDAADNGQPLGLNHSYHINSIFHLEKKHYMPNWNVTRMIYKPKNGAAPVSAPATESQSTHQLQGQIRNALTPLWHQPQACAQDRHRSQSPQTREDLLQGHNSLANQPTNKLDRNELIKALARADEMEKRAKEAEQNLADVLHQLEVAQNEVVALKKMAQDAQDKAVKLQQKVQAQQSVRENYSQAEVIVSAMEKAIDKEDFTASAKVQLTQLENKISSLETLLIKANDTNLHLQQEICSLEKRAIEADQRANEAEQHVTQVEQCANEREQHATQTEQRAVDAEQRVEEMAQLLNQLERRAIEAEANSNQAERNAQQSQDQAINSEIRAREAERRMAELEEQLRDASARTDRAERRAAFVDRGEERTWALDRNEINLTDTELGRGGWAVVKVAEFRGISVAAKCIYNNILSDHNRALFVREMNMAARLRHPNLVQFVGATIDGDPLILMELLPTTLRIELQHGPPNHAQIVAISKDVARALNYMHLMRPDSLIHRDVSSANVLLERSSDNMWKGKLSDYGSVNFVQRALSAGPGNPLYAAPEANDPRLHSPKMDVYSFGVLLSEMCSGRFPDADRRVLVERVTDQQMANLIRRCLVIESDRRPTFSDIVLILNAL